MKTITWDDFERVELRVGTVTAAEPFPEARKPAFRLTIDFGPEIGVRQSSSQLTHLYDPETLVGQQIIAVVNFPPKRIGPFVSEVLVTGFVTEEGVVTLAVPERPVPNGSKLA
ncbi:MAG: tRNA-binding protein [Capsulimonadales bacterium]|nr:tRNA-binding protein [Capsulimonadales bacterium]